MEASRIVGGWWCNEREATCGEVSLCMSLGIGTTIPLGSPGTIFLSLG